MFRTHCNCSLIDIAQEHLVRGRVQFGGLRDAINPNPSIVIPGGFDAYYAIATNTGNTPFEVVLSSLRHGEHAEDMPPVVRQRTVQPGQRVELGTVIGQTITLELNCAEMFCSGYADLMIVTN